MEALKQSQPLCIISNLISILSAIACVIYLTLIGIIYMATNRKPRTNNKQSNSTHDQLPKPTGAKLGKSFRDSKAFGKHPSIAVNNHSLVVEVFMQYEGWWWKKQLKYRIGQLGDSRINWRGNGPYDYSTGQRPRIAINSNNMVVAVHENPSLWARDRCVYRVGLVGQETIEWGKETEFVEGCCPDVAITESKAILTFTTSGHRYYFVGSINSETKTIGLREDAKSFPNSNASQLSIAVNNGGRVVAAYFTGGSICCMAGALKEDGEIEWHSKGPQNLVRSTADAPPVVSINSQGYVVVVLSLSNKLYCFVGRTFDNNTRVGLAMEGSVKKYGSGYYPAASIDDENNIVEIHETDSIFSFKLFYHVGKLLFETSVSVSLFLYD